MSSNTPNKYPAQTLSEIGISKHEEGVEKRRQLFSTENESQEQLLKINQKLELEDEIIESPKQKKRRNQPPLSIEKKHNAITQIQLQIPEDNPTLHGR